MATISWLPDASEPSLRGALETAVPHLAGLPLAINPRFPQSNPLYWSSSAVIDDAYVVKYAWSEVRAVRVWREGVVLQRLIEQAASNALPDVVAVTSDPALLVTRLVRGEPLSREWATGVSDVGTEQIAGGLAAFLAALHSVDAVEALSDLPFVRPTAQADTARLRAGYPRLVDGERAASVRRWCDWVDDVLEAPHDRGEVLCHGDLHGYNQVWDHTSASLRAVVDFEECGTADPTFDLRYLPGNAGGPRLLRHVIDAYGTITGRELSVERALAWNVLTHLGDALWRTEAGAPLPGGGTAASWVDIVPEQIGIDRPT